MRVINKLKRLWYGQSSEAQKTIIAGVFLAVIFFAGGIALGKSSSEKIPSDRIKISEANKQVAANFENSIANKVTRKDQISKKAFWIGNKKGYLISSQEFKGTYAISYYNTEEQDITNPAIITSQCSTKKDFLRQAKIFNDSKKLKSNDLAFYSKINNSIIAFKRNPVCYSTVSIQNFTDPKEILIELQPGEK